jgi:hypothetical protein
MDELMTYRKLPLSKSTGSPGRPVTLDRESRSVSVVAATETPVPVWDWERGLVPEVLLMSGLQLPSERRVPLLDSHSRYTTKDLVGSAINLRVSGLELLAEAVFSSVDRAEEVLTKIEEGHLRDFSVGYLVRKATFIPKDQAQVINGRTFTGPLRVATNWRIKELSVTPIGADEFAKARSAGRKESQMENEQVGIESQRAPQPLSITEATAAGIHQERNRILEIQAMCERFGCEDLAEQAITTGRSVEDTRQLVLGRVEARHAPEGHGYRPPLESYGRVQVTGREATEKRRNAIVDGFVMRSGMNVSNPAPGADEYRSMTLLELAKECLEAEGTLTRGLSPGRITELALRPVSGRAMTTGDFPSLLANVGNKTLQLAYREAAPTWEPIVKQTAAKDFKTLTRPQISEFGNLDVVDEGQEYKYGDLLDHKETFAVTKQGKLFAIYREALINDDLQALTSIPRMMGASAARAVADAVWGKITANAAMSDTFALFHTNHKNLGSAAAPGEVTLSELRKLMRLQTGPKGALLNVAPKYLLVPAALETACEKLLYSTGSLDDNKNAGVINPFGGGTLTMIVEPRLDANSITAYYLSADPGTIDTIELAWLGGVTGPYLEQREGWAVDGMEMKVRIEFGVGVLDYRGLAKNAGA